MTIRQCLSRSTFTLDFLLNELPVLTITQSILRLGTLHCLVNFKSLIRLIQARALADVKICLGSIRYTTTHLPTLDLGMMVSNFSNYIIQSERERRGEATQQWQPGVFCVRRRRLHTPLRCPAVFQPPADLSSVPATPPLLLHNIRNVKFPGLDRSVQH